MNDFQLIEVLEYWNFWIQDRRTGVYRKDYVEETISSKEAERGINSSRYKAGRQVNNSSASFKKVN
ncbi:MAG: hypothetical protein DRH21_04795 [Deltaproteobacteria bacterium]|nr:MAG: hypothetical protein DRH21_04795 [Deltaproteobacteria bacterium]